MEEKFLAIVDDMVGEQLHREARDGSTPFEDVT